ncbi:SH3 domain-containing protein [Thalassomonas sp. RHCl1]|uniref:SH3 domain-containing protein n=1 Tax=Thalassomonas sp. RHCl1 TaxID=2995320 RepID=UPI00248AEAB4|nr:SH3 domain-containing protein [Thalassomonas sp. RHCl1]
MKAIVTQAHESNYPDPVKFKCGDTLVLGEVDIEFPNWIKVTTTDGNTGWAPLQYISACSDGEAGVAQSDYDANELNTVPGEELKVMFELNEWFRVMNSRGVLGWVPVKTVKCCHDICTPE